MSSSALLVLQALNYAEPVLTLLAVATYWRMRGGSRPRAMGAYLAVRLICLLVLDTLLLGPGSLPLSRQARYAWYYGAWWVGEILLAWLLLRVAGEELRNVLGALPGIRRFVQVGYRWLIAALLLMMIPVAVGVNIWRGPGPDVTHLIGAISLTELVPLLFVLTVGLKMGTPWRSRFCGILLGLSLEPAVDAVNIWFYALGQNLLNWNNLIHQTATDLALMVWVVYFLAPMPEVVTRAPSAKLLQWDQIARKALKHRLPEEEQAAEGDGAAEPAGKDA